jgi:hypothetical protein
MYIVISAFYAEIVLPILRFDKQSFLQNQQKILHSRFPERRELNAVIESKEKRLGRSRQRGRHASDVDASNTRIPLWVSSRGCLILNEKQRVGVVFDQSDGRLEQGSNILNKISRLFNRRCRRILLRHYAAASRAARAPSSKSGPAGVASVLYYFSGGPDGRNPGGLIQGIDGIFYGTTTNGGSSNLGTVFAF